MPQVVVWRKGIDTARFHPKFRSEEMRAKLTGGHSEAPLLLYVGRLAREQRIQDLKPLLARFPGARLALVGTGPREGELKELFQASNCVPHGQAERQGAQRSLRVGGRARDALGLVDARLRRARGHGAHPHGNFNFLADFLFF